MPALEGPYALALLAKFESIGGGKVECGMVRFGRGNRSPAQGLHSNSLHEVAVVLSGRVLVETATTRFEAAAGDYVTCSPGEPHATTGLEDSTLLFVLVDPTREVG
jgi:quercetin dioxygenase-like cupin family protein